MDPVFLPSTHVETLERRRERRFTFSGSSGVFNCKCLLFDHGTDQSMDLIDFILLKDLMIGQFTGQGDFVPGGVNLESANMLPFCSIW